ncbi:Glycosyl transferases group 1 [uncultured archaeon]|nr:Glycosyl transferases group 1 [uncultured archaeon]
MKINFAFLDDLSERDAIRFYSSIDVLAHSSKIGESFGYTIAEAMAAKKPVVVNSTPLEDNAQIELVDNFKTGLIANSSQPYARAIGYLLNNKLEREEMGLAGYRKAKRNYDAPSTTRVLEKIYLELAIEKGIDLDDRVTSKYKDINYFPSREDIISFKGEYDKRLKESFGRQNLSYCLEVLGYKHLLNKPFLKERLKRSAYGIRRLETMMK